MPPAGAIGEMTEQLVIATSVPVPVVVAGLTAVGGVATAITALPHRMNSDEYATLAGATPAGYNGDVRVTVLSPTSFTYPVASGLASPATGPITATYYGDALGGREKRWTTIDTIWAALISPLSGQQRMQIDALQARSAYTFQVYLRGDLAAGMRALWTPSPLEGGAQKTLNISAVLPSMVDPRVFMNLETGE